MSRNRGHEITYMEDKGLHKAICRCKYGSGWGGKGDAQEWAHKHMRLVEQARAHLRDKAPTIKDQHGYFQSKADDPEETRENREIWQRLADELRPRLPSTRVVRPSETDEALTFDVKYQPKRVSRDRP